MNQQLAEKLWRGTAGNINIFSFMVVFFSPKKSLCSARDPQGTCLRVRDEACVLTKAAWNGQTRFQQ